ncbi:hypothetical protein T08_11061 [Trichinella sp. T8]|nr:hypothetical protein T08_11061 [Trichinella sp. T8]
MLIRVLAALFQYFRQEWMTDERLPLWNVHNDITTWKVSIIGSTEKRLKVITSYELLQLLIAEQGVMDTLI